MPYSGTRDPLLESMHEDSKRWDGNSCSLDLQSPERYWPRTGMYWGLYVKMLRLVHAGVRFGANRS